MCLCRDRWIQQSIDWFLCIQRNKKRETCGDRPGKFDLRSRQSVTNRPQWPWEPWDERTTNVQTSTIWWSSVWSSTTAAATGGRAQAVQQRPSHSGLMPPHWQCETYPQVQGPVPSPARPAYQEQVSMRRGSQDALSICMSQSEYNGISMPVLEQKSWKCLACPPTSPQPLSRFRRGRLTKESGQKKASACESSDHPQLFPPRVSQAVEGQPWEGCRDSRNSATRARET